MAHGRPLLTLLVDNYDSYTYNLYQMLAVINGVEPLVIHNDSLTEDEVLDLLRHVDNVVISPGPGRPDRSSDFGVCTALLRQTQVPVLGVCLGHQGLASVNGGVVQHAPEPMHGRISTIRHDGTSKLFVGIPERFSAVRYHSLVVAADPWPACLRATAWTDDGVIMAMEHRSLPQWAVQFHPESISTQFGHEMLSNFVSFAAQSYVRLTEDALPSFAMSLIPQPPPPSSSGNGAAPLSKLRVISRLLPLAVDAERVFAAVYGARVAFWLDSARVIAGVNRFSFMGALDGPLSFAVRHFHRPAGSTQRQRSFEGPSSKQAAARDRDDEGFFAWLSRESSLISRRLAESEQLPFDFTGGFVGYLGYELRGECGSALAPDAEGDSLVPTAFYMMIDRFLAFDHETGEVYAACLVEDVPECVLSAEEWMSGVLATCARLPDTEPAIDGARVEPSALIEQLRGGDISVCGVDVKLARDAEQYLSDVRECQRLITEGESYEVCLTTQIDLNVANMDAWRLYMRLRRNNPAPYAAFMNLGGGVGIASSSPERFLKVAPDGTATCKPIKGTAPRGKTQQEDDKLRDDLQSSVKDMSENLMIVDLIRNDLGLVCERGSVKVPRLMRVESYATVHQLVSTIVGVIRNGLSAVDAARACFPPGSMTGAPKIRTMEIIDKLETRPRGVYAGALGYFSANGAADLSVVIRTAVVTPTRVSGGAGGAVIILSDVQGEFDEMLLKACSFVPSMVAEARSVGRSS